MTGLFFEFQVFNGFDILAKRPPAEGKGTTNKLPVTPHGKIATDLIFSPAQVLLDLFVGSAGRLASLTLPQHIFTGSSGVLPAGDFHKPIRYNENGTA